MLSSQTKDQMTAKAMAHLKDHGLTIENILKTEQTKIQDLIYGVGFYRRKAEYILKTTRVIQDQHDGQVPSDLKTLMSFPGVGVKMALLGIQFNPTCNLKLYTMFLVQQSAFNITEGISVDTHVHRICNLLEWTDSKNPDETRIQLQEWVPKEKWAKVNHMLVGFGQTICKPISPLCNTCKINHMCPSAFWNKPKNAKKIKLGIKINIFDDFDNFRV